MKMIVMHEKNALKFLVSVSVQPCDVTYVCTQTGSHREESDPLQNRIDDVQKET